MKLKIKNIKRLQLLVALAVVIGLGGYGYFSGQFKIPSVQKNTPSPSPTPQPYTSPTQWIMIEGGYGVFSTKIFMKRNQTQIVIPIKFEKQITSSWLAIETNGSNKPSRWLLTHPQLVNLNWNSVEENSVYLYQKAPQYKNVTDFLENPPKDKRILIDESIRDLNPYKHVPAGLLTKTTDINTYDFILTTYKQNPQHDTITEYGNIVDSTDANVSTDGKLNWSIMAETSEDNPMYIGHVSVDYIQYDRSKQK